MSTIWECCKDYTRLGLLSSCNSVWNILSTWDTVFHVIIIVIIINISITTTLLPTWLPGKQSMASLII